MSFDVTLLSLGTLLLLLGLLGRIEAEKISIGTNSYLARIVSGLFGALFLVIALSQYVGFTSGIKFKEAAISIVNPKNKAKYLVIHSTKSEQYARERVDKLIQSGYSAEARRSKNGYVAVAIKLIGNQSFDEVKENVMRNGLCDKDAYASTGERLVELLYPK
ncbi:MAG: hypothetical protein D3910_19205 [Candidatus Electrothrix sp. ATG2]|nr:hypothetical protein [Candidatus Electrothrix sp. ATG2]